MIRDTRLQLAALGLLVAVGLFAACSGSDSTGGMFNRSNVNEEDGFTMVADPNPVVIDLTDPGVTIDPDTGKGYAETTLTVMAVDDEGTPQEGLEVSFAAQAGELASGGSPVLTDAEGVATDTLTVTEDDAPEVMVSASDGSREEIIPVEITVIYPNRPPEADAGEDLRAECVAEDGTTVTLDGSGSSDPDSTPETNDDIVSFEWFLDYDTPDELLIAEGEVVQAAFELGSHEVTLLVTDSEGETDTDTVAVEIVDTTPPEIQVSLDPAEIWPPNHRMVDVHASVVVMDCDHDVEIVLVSVTSNEPDNGIGDGNTEPDIMGVSAGTEDYHFQVRAERAGPGSGRVYTVVYRATDQSGNEAIGTAYARVPHDQGH
jgi:hypothetical protein